MRCTQQILRVTGLNLPTPSDFPGAVNQKCSTKSVCDNCSSIKALIPKVTIRFLKPGGAQVVLGHSVLPRMEIRTQDAAAWEPIEAKGLIGAVQDVVEVQVPLDALHVRSGDSIALIVTLTRGEESTHYPAQGAIEFQVPSMNPGATNWSA